MFIHDCKSCSFQESSSSMYSSFKSYEKNDEAKKILCLELCAKKAKLMSDLVRLCSSENSAVKLEIGLVARVLGKNRFHFNYWIILFYWIRQRTRHSDAERWNPLHWNRSWWWRIRSFRLERIRIIDFFFQKLFILWGQLSIDPLDQPSITSKRLSLTFH